MNCFILSVQNGMAVPFGLKMKFLFHFHILITWGMALVMTLDPQKSVSVFSTKTEFNCSIIGSRILPFIPVLLWQFHFLELPVSKQKKIDRTKDSTVLLAIYQKYKLRQCTFPLKAQFPHSRKGKTISNLCYCCENKQDNICKLFRTTLKHGKYSN